MDRHLFDETRFTDILTRKLTGTTITREEADYFKRHLISDDPFVSRRCQEIIAEITASHPLPPVSPAHNLDMEKEYEHLLNTIRPKKIRYHKFITIAVILVLLLVIFLLVFVLL